MTQGFFPILFVLPRGLADAVMASGLIARLHQEIPHARFTLVADTEAAPLFVDTPSLEEVVVVDGAGLSAWLPFWRRARGRRWGLVVDLRGSALHRFLKTRRRAILRPGRRSQHRLLDLAAALKLEDEPPAPHIFLSPETRIEAEPLTAGEGPILALAPGAAWVGKAWPIERYAQLAIRLLGEGGPMAGGRLMVLGGPRDVELAHALRHVTPKDRFIDLVNKADLLTVQACLGQVRLFVGNDTGLAQMAAAAGAPTLTLFGPSDEAVRAPWGPLSKTLRGGRDFAQIRQIDPALNQSLCHMMDLGLDAVTAAAKDLLAETENSLVRDL